MPNELMLGNLDVGCQVHYILPAGVSVGQHRGAVVTSVVDPAHGIVNLRVEYQIPEDFQPVPSTGITFAPQSPFVKSVYHDPNAAIQGTWHWPEKTQTYQPTPDTFIPLPIAVPPSTLAAAGPAAAAQPAAAASFGQANPAAAAGQPVPVQAEGSSPS